MQGMRVVPSNMPFTRAWPLAHVAVCDPLKVVRGLRGRLDKELHVRREDVRRGGELCACVPCCLQRSHVLLGPAHLLLVEPVLPELLGHHLDHDAGGQPGGLGGTQARGRQEEERGGWAVERYVTINAAMTR